MDLKVIKWIMAAQDASTKIPMDEESCWIAITMAIGIVIVIAIFIDIH